MARPEEKAQAMLNKWVRMREESDPNSRISRDRGRRQKRPFLASQCEHLADAEHFRMQIIREIGEGVRRIQNPGLGEHALRDLNDDINKLFREKHHWNRRIRELGGKDYNKEERRAMLLVESEGGGGVGGGIGGGVDGGGGGGGSTVDPGALAAMGVGLKGSGGYRYFGAARDLPGVRELFARHAARATKRKRGDIYKYITPDYYGLRDEEDGVLLELEGKMAANERDELSYRREEFRDAKTRRTKGDPREGSGGSDESSDDDAFYDGVMNGIVPQAAVPSREVIAKALLEKKKEALLNRFA
ncbi:hypothetical protein ACHAXA_007939 [Cyclostephanos tholiformis]|uniref:Pre-mRNA-splicing factor ISY1 n=1 Tax=Cyclostephanos tholiformis TaxID=382380 RepID=A0ABD3R202_9STRA